MRPAIVPALARLMCALYIHNETWVETANYRDRNSVNAGMCSFDLIVDMYIRMVTDGV